jgi:hypothetical protein
MAGSVAPHSEQYSDPALVECPLGQLAVLMLLVAQRNGLNRPPRHVSRTQSGTLIEIALTDVPQSSELLPSGPQLSSDCLLTKGDRWCVGDIGASCLSPWTWCTAGVGA